MRLNYITEISEMLFYLAINLAFFYIVMRLSAYFVRKSTKLRYASSAKDAFTVGFFHPFCNSGGGGERVLWSAVKAIQDK